MSPIFPPKLNHHYHILLLLFLAGLTYSDCYAISGTNNSVLCVEKERHALLQFKQGILVDKCSILASWEASSLDCCSWRGVHCNNHSGHVTMLRLHRFPTNKDDFVPCLQGTLSDSLAELTHLKYLDLGFNDFQGQSIPKFIGSLSNLEYLNLSSSMFQGVIPHEIGNLSKLSSLDLNCVWDYNCLISVERLSWLSKLKLLRYIDLSGVDLSLASNWVSVINRLPFLETVHMDECSLSSKLPTSPSFINSSNTLRVISLSGNNFTGTSIFQWLHNFSRIETTLSYLDLSSNNLNEIPSFIWKLNSLSYLNLGNNNSSGLIPSKISNLKRLTYLDLGGNKVQLSRLFLKSLGKLCRLQRLVLFGNDLSNEFSEVIESLSCSQKSLVFLSLSNTRVCGHIPNSVSKFSSLKELYVDNNQLNGTLSEGVGQLTSLENFDVSSNFLNGAVSYKHFSNLSNLSYLDLSDNQALKLNLSSDWTPPFQLGTLTLRSCNVGPNFPKWILTQQSLTSLEISSTGICDVIPKSFWISGSRTLNYLNMSNNMIHGVLPDLSFAFIPFIWIDMSSNKLSGAIPSFLGKNVTQLLLNNNTLSEGLVRFLCQKTELDLISLDLSNNLFSDTIPDCLGYFPMLTFLQLQNNNISGKLPPSVAAINSLQALHLGNNRLSGELPISWVNSTSLVVLDFAYNPLIGSIPPSFWYSLPCLRVLNLKHNNFSMTIPSNLCQLTSLQILDLSSNHISGPLLKCLYNFTMMASKTNLPQPIEFLTFPPLADFLLFMWKRKERSFEVSLGLLRGIDISDNNLEGQIPDDISSLVGIEFLNLSYNNLSGPLPPRIGQLTSLEFIDLSHNQLSGKIPTSLGLIDDLAMLDLSNNNLSGKIPLGTQLQGFDASSFMGNPKLCEEPLPKCLGDQRSVASQNGDPIAQHKEHKNDDIFLGLAISVVFGFITGFWGVYGTLVLKRSWRLAMFRFYDNTKDKIYVMVIVIIARACRRSSS